MVALLKNFRKAAEHLNTTQPAISSRINALETLLRARLFERGSREVRLTPKGLALLPTAERIVRLSQELKSSATSTEETSGHLRIGVNETVVHAWLPAFLGTLNKRYPLVDVDLNVDVSTNLRNSLVDRGLDLAILLGPISEFSIQNVMPAPLDMTWVAGPDLARRLGPLGTLETLGSVPILTLPANTRPYNDIRDYFKSLDTKSFRIFASSSLFACIQMARDSIGVAAVPRIVVADDIQAGRLVELDYAWRPSAQEITIAYPREPWSPLVEDVVRLAKEIADKHHQ